MAERNPGPSDGDVRDALARVLGSASFAASPRLQEFLSYIVDEALAGRADGIRAKTIAVDVYGRPPEDEDLATNVVRVDGGRLRRLLSAYYDDAGRTDPVRIDVPKGAYVPRFAARSSTPAAPAPAAEPSAPRGPLWIGGAVLAALVAVALAAAFWPRAPAPEPTAPDGLSAAEREAVFEVSPARLQAVTLADQGRDLIFPAFDLTRVIAARGFFERAIALDPGNADAHAGLAIVDSMRGFVAPPGPETEALKAAGLIQAEEAVAMAPTSGWAQIAKAWALFVTGDGDEALNRAALATRLSPREGEVQDYRALIHLFTGDFETAARLSDTARDGLPYAPRSPRLNALGGALFFMGDYPGAIAALNSSAAQGAPVSALSTAVLIAAYQANGQTDTARRLAREHRAAWPEIDVAALARQMFDTSVDLTAFETALEAAGALPGEPG